MTTATRTTAALARRAILAAILGAAGLAAGGNARAYATSDLVGVGVVDRATGAELPIWRRHGRAYVAGQPGARYGLRLSNHTGGRVLVVVSVDGVNILTGETARYDQRGYVLGPYEAYDLNGWRKSDDEVAAFTFAALSQSYAARTGRPGDVGVIGVAAFVERAPFVAHDVAPLASQARRRGSPGSGWLQAPPPALTTPPVKAPMSEASRRAAPSPSAALAPSEAAGGSIDRYAPQPRDEKLGTGHGEREWSYVTRTTFVRATFHPQSVRQIEYDTYANLEARGVLPPTAWPALRPRPFPLEPDRAGFVPDPPEER